MIMSLIIRSHFVGSRALTELVDDPSTSGVLNAGPADGVFVSSVKATGFGRTNDQTTDLGEWQHTIALLAEMDFFAHASFLYCESLTEANRILRPTSDGYRLVSGRSYELTIHVLVPNTSGSPQLSRTNVDEDVLRLREPAELRFGHKYSTHSIPIRTVKTSHGNSGFLRISPDVAIVGPEVKIQVYIEDGRIQRLRSLASLAVPAGLAASAGILPPSAPIWLKAGMVVVGSAGLALAARPQI